MKNVLALLATVLFGQLSMGAAVGDFAKYNLTMVEGTSTLSAILIQKIVSVTVDKYEIEYTTDLGNNSTQVKKEWKAKNQVCDTTGLTQADLIEACAQMKGTMGTVTVKAGTFTACTTKENMITTSLGLVPFCAIKTHQMNDHGNISVELIDYKK